MDLQNSGGRAGFRPALRRCGNVQARPSAQPEQQSQRHGGQHCLLLAERASAVRMPVLGRRPQLPGSVSDERIVAALREEGGHAGKALLVLLGRKTPNGGRQQQLRAVPQIYKVAMPLCCDSWDDLEPQVKSQCRQD